MKLFMVLIGCKPKGRHTEQHDIFFGIAEELKDLIPQLERFWPEAKGNMHLDAWKMITTIDDYAIDIIERTDNLSSDKKLFFINLGGYKKDSFDEFHYKLLIVAAHKSEAIQKAKQTAFYQHTGFDGAPSHVDDKYGVDVDDVYEIEDVLSEDLKEKYSIMVKPSEKSIEDELHLGYFKLDKL